jgi:hypothetical protein
VRNFLILLSLWLGLTANVFAAETLSLTDGTSVSGDIVKFDDNGVMIHTTADAYTTLPWAKFSQEAFKQLAANPKIKPLVEPFIEPTEADRPPKAEIKAPVVTRSIKSPDQLHPSLFGGLLHSSLGCFILLVIYVANLYAAFEIAVVRGKPIGAVIGLSAVLPVIGPIFFLTQPIKAPPTEAEAAVEGAASAPAPGSPEESIQIASASWQAAQEEQEKKALPPQVFARGKYTFNKRFIETKFAGFIGEPKGDAKTHTMEIRTLRETYAVEQIMQVGATEAMLETPNGQVTVPFADIQEVKLNPKPA